MKRKMTVVFHDEDLYTRLKIEAVKRRRSASDIVADAVSEWLEDREDPELLPIIRAARQEWKEKGGIPWEVVDKEMREAMDRRDKSAKAKRVRA